MATSSDPADHARRRRRPAVRRGDRGEHRAAAGHRPVGARLAPAAAQQGRARLRRRCSSLLVALALAAPLWADQVAKTGAEQEPPLRHDHRRRQAEQRRRVRRRPDRPARGRPTAVLPRRRRATAATSWCACSTARATRSSSASPRRSSPSFLAVIARPARRLLPRLDVDAIISRGLDILWAFPVLLLGVALGVSLALGGLKLGPLEIAGRLEVDPDAHHRRRRRRLPRAADPRPGAVAAREGVRRGRPRPGRRPTRGSCSASCCRTSRRRSSSSSRCSSPTRSCSRRRCRSSAPACSRPSPSWGTMLADGIDAADHRAAPDDRAGPHARADRPVAERLRRRRARRARPAREGQAGAARPMGRFIIRRLLGHGVRAVRRLGADVR